MIKNIDHAVVEALTADDQHLVVGGDSQPFPGTNPKPATEPIELPPVIEKVVMPQIPFIWL